MASPNDTTTELNPGSGGDVMDESVVVQSDGVTEAKRPRVVIGDDAGELYDRSNPMPTADASMRRMSERSQLLSVSKLDVSFATRHRERVRVGDRLDVVDRRGPGGR